MTDQRTVEITVDAATRLTQLIATYGIYALVTLFMFYLLHRERKNLKEAATPEEKRYQQRIYTRVLWVTIVLSFLAAGIWFYGAFLYQHKIVIEGTLKNMREQAVMPVQLGDPPMVSYRLDAFRGDVKFYSRRQAVLSGSNFDLDWALISPRGLKTLQLVFQQEFCTIEGDDQSLQVVTLEQQPLMLKPQRGNPTKTASIDFNVHEALLHEQIHLVYQPDRDVKKIGILYIVQDGVRTEIPWDEDKPVIHEPQTESQSASRDLGFTGVAWAQNGEQELLFGPNGEIAPQMSERLKLYLESEDLQQQLAAKQALTQAGARSFPMLKTVLHQGSPDHHSRNRLLHNIATAFQEIETSQKITDVELSGMLAQALYEIGDYTLAAEFFLRVPHSPSLPAQVGHQRAISYMNAGRYDDAERIFKSLLESVENPRQKSTILTNLGTLYNRKGDPAKAKGSYEEAIAVYPQNVAAVSNLGSIELSLGNLTAAEEILERGRRLDENNPHVLNNLAYVYAIQGKELDKALAYVDQALASNGENPQFLDTKGWVLYRRGQPHMALEYLEKAVRKSPDDKEKLAHIEEVRKALRSTPGS